ncbi:1096_t:CDS:2 [Funneliformis geosporum]|nr:1096_t:CDS:2 [Funneliformis geosporum]
MSENSSISSTPLRMSTHEGQGPDIVVSSPSTRRSVYLNIAQPPEAIKKQLQDRLNEKSQKIQMTAELGQALLKQKSELEQRIQELDQTQGDEVPQEIKDKLTELEKQAKLLETTTAKVFLGSKGLSSDGDIAGSPGSSTTSMVDPIPTTATASSRPSRREINKSKNRKNDIEFAAEIGQGLLVEVRRLQALLQEKEERIKELEVDKAELERVIEMLNKQLRGKEESEERYKEENWNLEVAKQELSAQLDDLQQQLAKAHKEERLTAEYVNLKTRHDKDMANNRRHVAALNREKNDLMKSLDDLKNQFDSLQASSRIRKRTPEPGAVSSEVYTDEFGQPLPSNDNDTSNGIIPAALQGKNLNIEVETLKALGVSNRMIGNLRANLQKEKSEKYELKKLLADSQEQIEAMRYETEFADPTAFGKKPKSKRPKRLSESSNGLPNIDENEPFNDDDDSQDDNEYFEEQHLEDGDDDVEINKNNRPSSDMFKPRKPELSRKSKNSFVSSIMSSKIDEDIIPGVEEEEFDENDEIVAAQRAEALNNLTKLNRNASISSKTSRLSTDPKDPASLEVSSDPKSIRNSTSRESVVRMRISEFEDILKHKVNEGSFFRERKSGRYKIINLDTGEEYEEEIKDDASSVDSFTSANEVNSDSKRESAASKRESTSKLTSNRRSSIPTTSGAFIETEIVIPKEFKEVSVQTDKVPEMVRSVSLSIKEVSVQTDNIPEVIRSGSLSIKDASVQTDNIPEVVRSDSLSTIHTGKFTFGQRDTVYGNDSKDDSNARQSVLSVPEDNKIDKRFTLELSPVASGHQKNQRYQQRDIVEESNSRGILQPHNKLHDQVLGLFPPPRPSVSPPSTLIAQAHTHRPITVNFGQQAGSSKVSHNPLNLDRKSSTDSQENLQINNTPGSRSIGNGVFPSHKHTLSSGSVSSVSSASTSAENIGRSDSSHVEAGSSTGPMTGPSGTDPNIIHAITQTMIGEYLYKYHRSNFGAGKRHKRFFWVHPYTKTLYWSIKDPGHYEPVSTKSKNGTSYFAYIESVKQVPDHNPSPPGLHYESLVIKTPERELKFTASSKERHDYWFQALSYLLQRPDEAGQMGPGQTPGKPARNGTDPWENQANMQSLHSSTSPNGSIKGSNTREIKKKSSFNKIQAMFRRDGSSSSQTSPLSSELTDGQYQHFGPLSSSNVDDDELEDLENVRQCCDGRHDVSKLERGPNKHHHNHSHHY